MFTNFLSITYKQKHSAKKKIQEKNKTIRIEKKIKENNSRNQKATVNDFDIHSFQYHVMLRTIAAQMQAVSG